MKRKKLMRQRGGKTHGWGAKKKHRGAGNRGGRGNAGSGKRADQKKPSYWNALKTMKGGQKRGKDYFGKHGFHSITGRTVVALNVRDLAVRLPTWVAEKKATKTGDSYTVDLQNVGFQKLLGTGGIKTKVKVTVALASASAIEKISAAGGSVTLTVAAEETAEAPATE